MIVTRNGSTMPQERYNAEWVQENEVGVVLKSFSEIQAAVRDLLDDGRLESLRANVAARRNVAVFEAVDLLARFIPAENVPNTMTQAQLVRD